MICTTLEQSKKLIELGISVNTADMFYTYDFVIDDINGINAITKKFKPEEKDVPAWSTEALMKLLPAEFILVGEYSTTRYEIDVRKYKLTEDVDLYQIAYGSRSFVDGIEHWKDMINTGEKENLLDCAFQMVCWLKENNKL